MKKLLLLTTLFLAFACSKDDEGENNEENQTFLQKYDGMGFKGGEAYWYFFDDTNFMAYVNEDVGIVDECTLIREGQNSDDGDSFIATIVTNDSNSLVYRIVSEEDGETYEETGTFTVNNSGDTLTLTYAEDDFGSYTKVNVSYSSLCN